MCQNIFRTVKGLYLRLPLLLYIKCMSQFPGFCTFKLKQSLSLNLLFRLNCSLSDSNVNLMLRLDVLSLNYRIIGHNTYQASVRALLLLEMLLLNPFAGYVSTEVFSACALQCLRRVSIFL